MALFTHLIKHFQKRSTKTQCKNAVQKHSAKIQCESAVKNAVFLLVLA
jgi:hypothetical protein